jgi:3-hydroxyacyl-CoA dehydrogenase
VSDRGIGRVAVIGSGAIGASWASQFLAAGLDVAVTDPAPGAEARLRTTVDDHWVVLDRLGLAPGASVDRLSFVSEPETAVAGADFVQENAPERELVKAELMARLDDATRPDVVIASSSSGLLPTTLQQSCGRHPERVLVGHPFMPPHLIPLVEVVAGTATAAAAVETAMTFYRSIGKCPIRVRTELPGHVTNRLQAALWREAYWLVAEGAASVSDIDTAISQGPGLRWAMLGPFATQHLSGGAGGITHVLEHLGPPMVEWWQTFQTPDWTPELVTRVIEGVAAELADVDPTAMLNERDALLESLITQKAKAPNLPGHQDEQEVS